MREPALHADAVAEVLAPEGDQTAAEGAARIGRPWADYVETSWDKFDFTDCEHVVDVEGRKLNYVELGDPDKPVLLYVHGLMGTWRNWIFNLLPFADRYRVIAIDLPGFGLSEMPRGEFTIDRYAWTVREFLGQLGIEKVTLIGNSMGGQIGAHFASQSPELLERLVLVDPAGFTTASKLMRKISPLVVLLNIFLLFGARVRKLISHSRALSGALTKIVLYKPGQLGSELILMLLGGVGKPGFVPAVKTIATTPVRRVTDAITVQTVIIWGRNDSLIPVSDAFRYAKAIPHARLELMDDVGHIPMFETPDRFNALLEQHLARPAQPPAGS